MATYTEQEVCTWGKDVRQYACVHAALAQQPDTTQKVQLCLQWFSQKQPSPLRQYNVLENNIDATYLIVMEN